MIYTTPADCTARMVHTVQFKGVVFCHNKTDRIFTFLSLNSSMIYAKIY